MKTQKFRKILIICVLFSMLILSACQVNLITEIDKNGSGTYVQEIGFQEDEASVSGFNLADEDFCAVQYTELPGGTSIRQEIRADNEIWCIYETPFETLDDLGKIYSATDTRINNLSMQDGLITYDITIDLSNDSGMDMGGDIFWKVTLPGSITENNADEQDKNTLTWKLVLGEVNRINAVSKINGLNLNFDDENGIWYIFGGLAGIVFCCLVPLVIAGIIIILIIRKKKNHPADPVTSVSQA
jgi:hypothetical protein